ncbi:unnamed protein product, partial [Laminaria digitata]
WVSLKREIYRAAGVFFFVRSRSLYIIVVFSTTIHCTMYQFLVLVFRRGVFRFLDRIFTACSGAHGTVFYRHPTSKMFKNENKPERCDHRTLYEKTMFCFHFFQILIHLVLIPPQLP